LDQVHDHIFCCRSGSAADTQAISDIVKYYLDLHRFVTFMMYWSRFDDVLIGFELYFCQHRVESTTDSQDHSHLISEVVLREQGSSDGWYHCRWL
jgi:hypothetical protein